MDGQDFFGCFRSYYSVLLTRCLFTRWWFSPHGKVVFPCGFRFEAAIYPPGNLHCTVQIWYGLQLLVRLEACLLILLYS